MKKKDIVEKIEYARVMSGLSWKELADEVGLNRQHINENGMEMNLSQLSKICDVTGFPASFFVGEGLQHILSNASYFTDFVDNELDNLGEDVDICALYPVQRTVGKLYSDVRWEFDSPLGDLTKQMRYTTLEGMKKRLKIIIKPFYLHGHHDNDGDSLKQRLIEDLYCNGFLKDEGMIETYHADLLPAESVVEFGEKKAMVNLFLHIYMHNLPNHVKQVACWKE